MICLSLQKIVRSFLFIFFNTVAVKDQSILSVGLEVKHFFLFHCPVGY